MVEHVLGGDNEREIQVTQETVLLGEETILCVENFVFWHWNGWLQHLHRS